jgi:hypothetical protein
MRSVTLTRDQLYELVWAEPLRVLATRYALSDVALAKLCTRLAIPRPDRAYWGKRARRQSPRRTRRTRLRALPSAAADSLRTVTLQLREDSDVARLSGHRRRRSEPNESAEPGAQSIVVAERFATAHPSLARTAAALASRNREDSLEILDPSHPRGGRGEPLLDVRVTPATVDRALRILGAVVTALEARGFAVDAEGRGRQRRTWIAIHNERIAFCLEEITAERGNDSPDGGHARRSYVFEPTGRLRLRILEPSFVPLPRRRWADRPNAPLETQLGDFVSGVIGAATVTTHWRADNDLRIQREKQAIEVVRARERRAAREVIRVRELIRLADTWDQARRLRAFIGAVRARVAEDGAAAPESEIARWLQWADDYSAELDPLSNLDQIHRALAGNPPECEQP